LKPTSYKTLLAIPFMHKGYAVGGWGVGNGTYGHTGSNNSNYAKIHMQPDKNIVILVTTNQGGDPGQKACEQVQERLVALLVGK